MSFLDIFFNLFHSISSTEAVLITVLLLVFAYYIAWRYHDVPPGPIGIPLLGYWPFINAENTHLHLESLKNKYGEIFSFNVTGTLYINLCSMKLIKEAHLRQSDCFLDRAEGYSLLKQSFEHGVAFVNGEAWKVQRKFLQQKFKEYGMLAMKENFSASVYDNLKETVEEIRRMEGKPFAIAELLTAKCSKIIRRILFNDQGITEEELKQLNHDYQPVISVMIAKNILLSGNVARYLVFPFMPSYKAMMRSHHRITDLLRNIIQRHKEKFDETQIMDIIDSYYKEKKDREARGDPTAKYFTDDSLLSNVYQFVTDGVLSVSFFICLFFEKLAECPEEQQRIYEELEDVLGPNRQPTMDDKGNLPYTNAFIYEVIRQNNFNIVPSLTCTKETTIQGYRIPKGAVTLLNAWSVNHDPQVYEEPHVFNPKRFLTVPGKPKADLPMVFGIGKRNCMGEPFTLNEVFLFVTTLVKNFHLTVHNPISGNIYASGDLRLCAQPRTEEQNARTK